MKKKFHDLLHQYKVEAFKISHCNETVSEATKEILGHTEEALSNAYHFHFHKDPDKDRLETFTMIKNFTIEALLPPVLEKIMRRVHVLERQHVELVQLVDNLLEALSEDVEKADSNVG